MSVAATPLEAPAGFLESIGATPARLEKAEQFRVLLTSANVQLNLVGASTLGDFWRRHFLDSAQLLWFAPRARVWVDLGAGAGLPGLVLAILLEGRQGARVHLVESTAKRCNFLRHVAHTLALPVEIHHRRAESLALVADIVTARACAPLPRLLEFARPSLSRAGKGLFLKGETVDREMEDARKRWKFRAVSHVSLSDPRGRILEVTELSGGKNA